MNKTTKIHKSTFENIYYICPHCHAENILNRISDLKILVPISNLGIQCLNCKKENTISGDIVTEAKYRWFLDIVDINIKNKEYSQAIVNLCVSTEIMMHEAIINKLFDRNPQYKDTDGHLDFIQYNQAIQDFPNKTICEITNQQLPQLKKYKKVTFHELRKLFLHLLQTEINTSPNHKKENFNELQITKINEIRNKIIHKSGYLPSKEEVLNYNNLIDSLYWIGQYLDIKDSILILNET